MVLPGKELTQHYPSELLQNGALEQESRPSDPRSGFPEKDDHHV